MAISQLQSYLQHAKAIPLIFDSLEQACQQARHAPQHSVVLIDHFDPDISHEAQQASAFKGIKIVHICKRSLQERPLSSNAIEAEPLFYRDLIETIALTCGRTMHVRRTKTAEVTPQAMTSALSVEEAIAANRLVLLAEDNETNREVIVEQLRLLGYTAETAEDGAIALEKWKSGRYAILLTDCHMPNMDGFELTAAIRQSELNQVHHPIIAITANAMQGEAERCRQRGMDDYLSKPLRLNELKTMMQKWLPLVQRKKISSTPQVNNDAIAADTIDQRPLTDHDEAEHVDQVFNPMTLNELVGDNPAMHKRLLTKYLSKGQDEIAAIEVVSNQQEIAAIANLAHTLKSASRSVGAIKLGELCEHIEQAARRGELAQACHLCTQLAAHFEQTQERIQTHLNTVLKHLDS
jgi:CheY-like chemotaxis protein/HPt (histidine-containing phosphotransfer) domain-containing protein